MLSEPQIIGTEEVPKKEEIPEKKQPQADIPAIKQISKQKSPDVSDLNQKSFENNPKTNENGNISQTNDDQKLLDDLNFSQPSKLLEKSLFFQRKAKQTDVNLDFPSKKVQRNFYIYLIGNDQDEDFPKLPLSLTKFLFELIPESYTSQFNEYYPGALSENQINSELFNELPFLHWFSKELQVLFLMNTAYDTYDHLNRENKAIIWFCTQNDQKSIDFLQKPNNFNNLSRKNSICVVVFQPSAENSENPDFQEKLSAFCKAQQAPSLKFPLENPGKSFEKLRKFIQNYIEKLLKQEKDSIIRLKEPPNASNSSTKLDSFLLNDIACFLVQNQGIIPHEKLEKRAFLLMGRPNDLLFSQYKRALEPFVEKFKAIFQRNYEENFKKTHRQRLLRPVDRNPLVPSEGSQGNRLVFTENEAKDLVFLALEHAVLGKTLKNRKKLKENPNKTVSFDSKLRGFLGFPSKNDFQEIKQFIEKEAAKNLEDFAGKYEKILSQRHKSAKPKVFYKTFDFLKRDFHGIELSKQISKEKLDTFADFLVKNRGNQAFSSSDLRVLTGFIGLKEFKHLEKRIERKRQEINELKNKQKCSSAIFEEIKEKSLQNLAKNAVYKRNFEKWTLIYLKTCKESEAAAKLLQGKGRKKLKKFNKIVEIELFEAEDAVSLAKLRKISRVLLLVVGNSKENVEKLRKLMSNQLLLPKKSHSLEKLQVLVLFFSETQQNAAIFEDFDAWVHDTYVKEKKLNIFVQEEPYFSLKTYFEYQFFAKLQLYFEKQAQKSPDLQVPQPDLPGILSRKGENSANLANSPAFSYENFIEILSQRLFPGESLDKELMDELFLGWFKKNANKFDTIDFNRLYFKAFTRINRLIAQIQAKVEKFSRLQRDLQVSLEKNEENYVQDEFLGVKIAAITGLPDVKDGLLPKNKGSSSLEHFFEAQHGEDRLFSGKFSLKDCKINEKFLVPFDESRDFLIKLANSDGKSPFHGLTFTLFLKEIAKTAAFPLEKLVEQTILCENVESSRELSARKVKEIGLEVKFKRLVYSKEKVLIKLNKISTNLQGLRDQLAHLLRCKYEILEVFGPNSQENAEFLKGNFEFLENLNAKASKEAKIDTNFYDKEIETIKKELEIQRKQMESLENGKKSEENERIALETELSALKEKLNAIKAEEIKEKARLSEEIRTKILLLSQLSQAQAANSRKLEALSANLKDFTEKLQQKELSKRQYQDKREEIVAFFTAGQASGHSEENLRKLQEYFLYVQKSILKFYNKAVIIEADVFEMKASSIKSGLGALAGSVPFIGNMLKFLIETAVDLKKAWDENKFVRKCIKFSTLIHSQRILAEITEHAAFETIKNAKKQELILQASDIKASVMDKLKEKLIEFFKKAKDFFTRKKKSKTQEKLLKDLDTPAKLLGNIDGGYLCTQAVELYKQEYMQFDAQDPYNKAGLVRLFVEILNNIDHKMYEKVIAFDEMKDFSAVTLLEAKEDAPGEVKEQEIEPSHEEIASVVLEDPVFKGKLEENSQEIEVFRERQEKNQRILKELVQQHDSQNETLENHEKRLTNLEKQAASALNFLGGLNQEIHDLNERVENLYNSMNVRYEEIVKKLESNEEVPASLIKPVQKQNSLEENNKNNDPFFMYLQKSIGANSSKSLKTSVGTPNKLVLTPLAKKP